MPIVTPIQSFSHVPSFGPPATPPAPPVIESVPQEVPVIVENPVAPVEDKVAPQTSSEDSKFALLAKKEKQLLGLKLDLQKREEALKARDEEYSKSYISKSKLMEDPLGQLKASGLDYNKLTEMMLNQPQVDPTIQKLMDENKYIKDEVQQFKQTYEDSQKKAYEDAKRQIKDEVDYLVGNDSTFETIKESGAQDAVVELIEQTYNTQGKLLSVEEASREIEEYLVQDFLKKSKLTKIQNLLKPPALEEKKTLPSDMKNVAQSPAPVPKTLTNSMSNSTRPLTARERAILAFNGQLH